MKLEFLEYNIEFSLKDIPEISIIRFLFYLLYRRDHGMPIYNVYIVESS